MRTYIYTATPSNKRGYDICITVYRVKRNQPHFVGYSDHQTASWKGAHGQAVTIIHDDEGIPYGTHASGSQKGEIDTYHLRGEADPCTKYKDTGHPRNAVRIFGIN